MNIPPPNQNPQMGNSSNSSASSSSWQGNYTGEERQKVVQIIINTLNELNGSSPNFNIQKLTKMAQDFEKLVYEKSPSKEDYLRSIKLKVHQLRLQKQQMLNNSNNNNQQQNQQQAQQQQQIPRNNSINNNNNNANTNPNMNQMNAQNLQFLQQQAQARSQSQAQIQARQQQLRNMANQQQQQQQQPPQPQPNQQQPQQPQQQPNPQQQQTQLPPHLVNLMRTSPIPPPLLNKMPNLPAGVNTWNQIFDLIRKEVIPRDMVPAIRDIHGMHLQLFMRQQQQKMNMQRPDAPNDNLMPGGVNNAGNNNNNNNNNNVHNFNNLTPQQREQILRQRRLQQQQQQQQQQQAQQQIPQQQIPQPNPNAQMGQQPNPQQLQQQQQQPPPPQQQQQQQIPPNQQKPQFQITPEDFAKYSNDALILLTRLQQQKQLPGQVDAQMKETFIKRFILHQKNQQWKQQQLQLQQQQQQQQQGGNVNNLGPNMVPPPGAGPQLQRPPSQQSQPQVQQQMQMQQQQQPQQPPVQQQMQNIPQPSPALNNMATPVLKQNLPMKASNLSSPLMGQRVTNQQQQPQPQPQPQQQQVQQPGNNNNNNNSNNMNRGRPVTAPANLNATSILPPLTDEARVALRQLIEEVSRNNVVLRDVTNLLSPQDKTIVRESMNQIQEQYGNVDSVISYFYLLTKNPDGTKRLIQMKYMTKNILDNLHRGIYLAAPDLLQKVRTQYAKYFDYVREQINMRRQQALQQGGVQPVPPQQRQPQQQVPPPQQQQQQQQQQQPNMVRQPPQQQMMQNQARNQQFMNQNPQIAMQQQQPMIPQQQDQMNMNNWTGMPGTGVNNNNNNNQMNMPQPPPQQMRPGINSSPLMPQQQMAGPQPIPIQPQQMQQQHPQMQQMQQQQQQQPVAKPITTPKPPAKTPAKKGTGQGRKKSKAGAATAPTPSALPATTPGALANAIKTPHSIPTPQIPPQSHSNKNTPTAQSPSYPVKATPSSTTPGAGSAGNFTGANANNVYPTPEIDIFAMNSNDSKSAKRRELIQKDPERFFYASLANLLDLDESIVDNVKVSPRLSNGKPIANSPLSPKITGEWTSEVKPLAITSSFRQVDAIKELTSDDIIASCGMLAIQEVEEPKSIKREREEEEEGDGLDTLFNEKKLKLENDASPDFDKFLYEPVSFDDWKDFVVSSIE